MDYHQEILAVRDKYLTHAVSMQLELLTWKLTRHTRLCSQGLPQHWVSAGPSSTSFSFGCQLGLGCLTQPRLPMPSSFFSLWRYRCLVIDFSNTQCVFHFGCLCFILMLLSGCCFFFLTPDGESSQRGAKLPHREEKGSELFCQVSRHWGSVRGALSLRYSVL